MEEAEAAAREEAAAAKKAHTEAETEASLEAEARELPQSTVETTGTGREFIRPRNEDRDILHFSNESMHEY